ncbi:MAG: glutamine-hydrolyzing carbamoyl-phosphate synthase small subunit [Planctomycetota bacterium]|nr:glutamine-hydrolyzing carbamoyl-phosphate synthase small subunit [Planctomycetota bacterium]
MNGPAIQARLALEDGTVFHGQAFGACESPHSTSGEVVFCTAMAGYQEALTDPSYAGQILTLTASQIGNYGTNIQDLESAKPQVRGFVIRELARLHSNHRADDHLGPWLAKNGILGIEGIDTRALVRKLRLSGAMKGVISSDSERSDNELIEMARNSQSMSGSNLAADVSPDNPGSWTEGLGEWKSETKVYSNDQASFHVVTLDCGAKRNIYRHLVERGCRVTSMPFNAKIDEIREQNPDGLFISNGPGDPEAVEETISTLREIAGTIPTFGICLGHQLLALALGAKTYKLKFGHRGANQPVREMLTGQIEITSQNHGFCVDINSLDSVDCEITHLHLNDNTVAGFRHRAKPLFSVQYHPEASPGPHESAYLFDLFIEMMKTRQPLTESMVRTARGMNQELGLNA